MESRTLPCAEPKCLGELSLLLVLLEGHWSHTLSFLVTFPLLRLTGSPLTFLGQKKVSLKLSPRLIKCTVKTEI